jgi:hypothetical protein
MSESPQPTSPPDSDAGVSEEIDALPVLVGESRVVHAQPSPGALPAQRRSAGVIPAVQAAAVAAGGFVAGAAVAGLVHRRQRRSPTIAKHRRAGRTVSRARTPGASGAGRAVELVQIVGSRSLLVDVHLLGGSGDH